MKLLFTIFVIIVTTFLAQAQQISSETLIGEWQGFVTTKFKDFRTQGNISLKFHTGEKISIVTSKQEEGNFAILGDSIIITLTNEQDEPIKLNKVQIKDGKLNANLVISSDPPGLSNWIELSKITTQISKSLAPAGNAAVCSDLDLPNGVIKLFEKYEIDCPITFPQKASYHELAFYRGFLSEIIKEVIGQRYETAYIDGKLVINVTNGARIEEVKSIVRPLLKDPNVLVIPDKDSPPCPPGEKCALGFVEVTDLKSAYISNGKIDFNRVWSKVIEIAESKNVRFLSSNRENNTWNAQTGNPSPVAQNQHGIFYEKISVQMADESNDGKVIRLHIKSEIWRKAAVGVKKPIKIEDQCSVGTATSFDVVCSDMPIMKAIINAITKTETKNPLAM